MTDVTSFADPAFVRGMVITALDLMARSTTAVELESNTRLAKKALKEYKASVANVNKISWFDLIDEIL